MTKPRYVVVENPGLECEREVVAFDSYKEARTYCNISYRFDPDDFWDILYRNDDGTLTTDF